MASDTTTKLVELQKFFLSEVEQEVASDFKRLKRVPSSKVTEKIKFFTTLSADDRRAFLECCSYWASAQYGFVVGMDRLNPSEHPFFERWSRGPSTIRDFDDIKSVPLMRSMVQQYKIDQHKGVRSSVSKDQFEKAASVRSVKAVELRKRARATLTAFGLYEIDSLGYYWCQIGRTKFGVSLDFGARHAQLRYSVVFPEFKSVHPLSQFRFERAVGFGLGDWEYIVENNVDDAFCLLGEFVQYCFELPDRIKTAVSSSSRPKAFKKEKTSRLTP